ncbi:MAG: hypothetical protein N2C14_08515 [Planctomycetales bacterium]
MSSTSGSPKPRSVADALGLGSLADGEPGTDPALLRRLYQHARGEDESRQLFENDPTFTRGWSNLDSVRAQELVAAFVPLDDADSLKEARRNAQMNLEAQPWNDLLGIDEPPIICKVKIHGVKWGLRFQSAERALRGREVINEDLPPVSNAVDEAEGGEPDVDDDTDNASDPNPPDAPDEQAADVLRRGGLPA